MISAVDKQTCICMTDYTMAGPNMTDVVSIHIIEVEAFKYLDTVSDGVAEVTTQRQGEDMS